MDLTGVAEVVRLHGVDRAREMAGTPHVRRLVDIAARALADEEQAVGLAYSGMCLTSLPYRKLPDEQRWVKVGHRVKLVIEPGTLFVGGNPVLFGVPWGSRGRILLIHLISEAVRTGLPEVVLGRSAKNALERMGVPYGGESTKAVRDQMARLSACSLRWWWERDGGDVNHRAAIVTTSFTAPVGERRSEVLSDAVLLDPEFFASLHGHAVPLSEDAVRSLSRSPMALDIYAFLAYRLHSLQKSVDVSWNALARQFGAEYTLVRRFRADFLPNLGAACSAYPNAKVEVTDRGIRLHPSRPPIAKRIVLPVAARRKAG